MTQSEEQEGDAQQQRRHEDRQGGSGTRGIPEDCPIQHTHSGSADDQMVCIKHAIAVREHTASWLGIAVVGGYIAITAFVSVKGAFMASSEAELMQVLERLNLNFGSAIGFVLGYYFATRANGSSDRSRDVRRQGKR